MEIKNWKTGEVIYQAEVNTIKELIEKAVKEGVSLAYANLSGADLSGAGLRCADFRCADFRYADIHDIYLKGANLCNSYFRGANLSGANLEGADLRNADLHSAKNVPENLPMACPKEGSFIAWKKVKDKLVKLEIPEDAKRSSATSNKCRCDKAKILAITDLDGTNPINEVINLHFGKTIYRVGEMVYPDKFDDNRWRECSNGIHFFMNEEDAINY